MTTHLTSINVKFVIELRGAWEDIRGWGKCEWKCSLKNAANKARKM